MGYNLVTIYSNEHNLIDTSYIKSVRCIFLRPRYSLGPNKIKPVLIASMQLSY